MIDWSIILPKELELEYKAKIHQLEEEKKVSYITSIERLSKEEGMQKGVVQGVEMGVKTIEKVMKFKGVDPNIIKEILELSQKELEKEV
jgi:predicted transposase YdaD